MQRRSRFTADQSNPDLQQAAVPPVVAEEVARQAARETLERGADGLGNIGLPSPIAVAGEALSEGLNRVMRGDAISASAMQRLHTQAGDFVEHWGRTAGVAAGLWAQHEAEDSVKAMLLQEAEGERRVHVKVAPRSADAIAALTAGKASAHAITLISPNGEQRQVAPDSMSVQELADMVAQGGTVRFHMNDQALAQYAGRTALAGIPTTVGAEHRPVDAGSVMAASHAHVARALFGSGEESDQWLQRIAGEERHSQIRELRDTIPLLRRAMAFTRDRVVDVNDVRDGELVSEDVVRAAFARQALWAAFAAQAALRRGKLPFTADGANEKTAAFIEHSPVAHIEHAPLSEQETDERSQRLTQLAQSLAGRGTAPVPSTVVHDAINRMLVDEVPRIFPREGMPGNPEQAAQVVGIMMAVASDSEVTSERAQAWHSWVMSEGGRLSEAMEAMTDQQAQPWYGVRDHLDQLDVDLEVTRAMRSGVAMPIPEAGAATWEIEASRSNMPTIQYLHGADEVAEAARNRMDDARHGMEARPDGSWGEQAHDHAEVTAFCGYAPQGLFVEKSLIDDPSVVEDAVTYMELVAERGERLSNLERSELAGLAQRMSTDSGWAERARESWWGDLHERVTDLADVLSPMEVAPTPMNDEAARELLARLPVEAQRGLRRLAGALLSRDLAGTGEGVGSSDVSGRVLDLMRAGDVAVTPAQLAANGVELPASIRLSPSLRELAALTEEG